MKELMKLALITFLLASLAPAFGQELFLLKKSMNPKNVLHFTARTEDCKLASPAVDNHWVMGEKGGHQEGLTNKEKPYFTPDLTSESEREAEFTMGALEFLEESLIGTQIKV